MQDSHAQNIACQLTMLMLIISVLFNDQCQPNSHFITRYLVLHPYQFISANIIMLMSPIPRFNGHVLFQHQQYKSGPLNAKQHLQQRPH